MTDVAVLAKAPVPGFAKTRLIPRLGPDGAADLQRRLTERAVVTACAAALGPVTLWCAPDDAHPAFVDLSERYGVRLAVQPDGDLGLRMLRAFERAPGSVVLIGTDCPVLAPRDLCAAVAALEDDADVAISPAEDGGYGLIAARRSQPALFLDIPWSTAAVMDRTRAAATAAGLRLKELPQVWDVDLPADLDRLAASGLMSRADDVV